MPIDVPDHDVSLDQKETAEDFQEHRHSERTGLYEEREAHSNDSHEQQ